MHDLNVRRMFELVRTDLARPWGLMTKMCAVGCATSLAFIEFSLDNSRLMIGHEWLDLSALCFLFTSVVTGIIAITHNTRHETSTMAPMIVLCAALAIGWPYLLISVADVPYFVLSNLLDLPFSHPRIASALLVAVGIVLLVLRRK